MSNQTIRTSVARTKILNALASGKSISGACRSARISRSAYYDWYRSDEAFAALVNDAIEDGTDKLEDSATKQALSGNTTLMVVMLKARRPDKYKDRAISEHTGPEGAPLVVRFLTRPDGPQ